MHRALHGGAARMLYCVHLELCACASLGKPFPPVKGSKEPPRRQKKSQPYARKASSLSSHLHSKRWIGCCSLASDDARGVRNEQLRGVTRVGKRDEDKDANDPGR